MRTMPSARKSANAVAKRESAKGTRRSPVKSKGFPEVPKPREQVVLADVLEKSILRTPNVLLLNSENASLPRWVFLNPTIGAING